MRKRKEQRLCTRLVDICGEERGKRRSKEDGKKYGKKYGKCPSKVTQKLCALQQHKQTDLETFLDSTDGEIETEYCWRFSVSFPCFSYLK